MNCTKGKWLTGTKTKRTVPSVIRQCRNEQIQEELPLIKEWIKIANILGIELEKAKETSKVKWNNKPVSENELIIGRTKYHKDNIEVEVTPGNPKKSIWN